MKNNSARILAITAIVLLLVILVQPTAPTRAGGGPVPGDEFWEPGYTLPGINGPVYAIVRDSHGNIYAGGSFDTAGGVRADSIAMWDGAHWQSLSTSTGGAVLALAIDADDILHAGGYFTSIGGVPA